MSEDVERRMEALGFKLVQRKNNRLFYQHPNGMLIRRKHAAAWLEKNQDKFHAV